MPCLRPSANINILRSPDFFSRGLGVRWVPRKNIWIRACYMYLDVKNATKCKLYDFIYVNVKTYKDVQYKPGT